MVICLGAGFFWACCFAVLWALLSWGCLVCLLAWLVTLGAFGPPSFEEGFQVQLLWQTLVASLATVLSVWHDVGSQYVDTLFLGAAAVPSSLLEFQVSVWAMLVGMPAVVGGVGCLLYRVGSLWYLMM